MAFHSPASSRNFAARMRASAIVAAMSRRSASVSRVRIPCLKRP